MNKTIIKFAEYVKDKLEKLSNDPVFEVNNQYQVVVTNGVLDKLTQWYFYSSLNECLLSTETDKTGTVITDQFGSISESLLFSPLNARERTEVVFYLIERNIRIGHILDDDKLGGLVKYDKFYEYGISPEIVTELFNSGKMEELLYTDDSLLDEVSLEMKNIMKKCIIVLDKNNPFVQLHQKIKTHYLDIRETYEEEDIIKVHQALLELEMDERTCNVIKVVLQNRLRTRKKCEERENIAKKSQGTSQIGPIKKHLSEKEYKKLKKEALPYFDLYTAMPKRDLSIDEVLYCASLLFMMGEEDHTIKALYDRSSYTKKLLKKAKESPVATYLMVYDQLEFYKEKLEIEDSITLLESYFQETFLSTPEEYSVWKQAIGEELKDVLEKIPAGYEYELQTKPQYEKGIEKVKARNTKK